MSTFPDGPPPPGHPEWSDSTSPADSSDPDDGSGDSAGDSAVDEEPVESAPASSVEVEPATAAGPGSDPIAQSGWDAGAPELDAVRIAALEAPRFGDVGPVAVGAAPAPDHPDIAPPVLGPTRRPVKALAEPPPLERHGPARILSMCNQKGGVGKTTSTINLGAALAEFGRRVLLVDFDPQGALSVGLGVNPLQLDRTVYNLLMDRTVTIDDVMLKTHIPGLDLLPSNIDLSAAEVQLVGEVAREQVLLRVLQPVLADYDVVLIDCQPSLGLLTVNALTASHGVIVPLECEFFALRGVALLIETIDKVRERLNPQLELEGILATMFDGRTLHGREVLARVVEAFGDKVFHTVIARTVKFPETTVAGEPITTYASHSIGAKAYRDLAKEVLAR
ncbi:MAG TPA: AAA family ATPase [Mycobacteriales bacterium]|nr:AAA family ATPase [Mycobacteriales bacterium]